MYKDLEHEPLPRDQGIEDPGKKMSSIGQEDLGIRA